MDIAHTTNKFKLRDGFSKQQLLAAEAIVKNKHDDGTRHDLQDELFFTIDGEDAKDFDDAICIAENSSGYRLKVAIADVSYFVEIDSALDKEALLRGTSTYLPNYVIPMLPSMLSNEECSLQPNKVRKALVCDIQINKHGDIDTFLFYRADIVSKYRLTYKGVDNLLEEKHQDDVLDMAIQTLAKLTSKLKKIKVKRRGLEITTSESQIVLDQDRHVLHIQEKPNFYSSSMIEEAMILANVCAARFIDKAYQSSGIYRTHSMPAIEDVIELCEKMKRFGIHEKISKNSSKKNIQNIYHNISNKIRDHHLSRHLYPMILQSLSHATYMHRLQSHFGLGLDKYTHFTSPIRRYPDLIAHRLIVHKLYAKNAKPIYDGKTLDKLAKMCSINERNAEKAQWSNYSYLCCSYVENHVGKKTKAIITCFYAHGAFVNLHSFKCDAFLPLYSGYRKNLSKNVAKSGRYRLGDELDVTISKVQLDKQRVTVSL